mmetsp:Transcript_5312/g.14923  ORF Transcript_5312/g.14923 Transcript_5312/m.14923 type:complete len:275 (-) Transcript_5312:161-985(-)
MKSTCFSPLGAWKAPGRELPFSNFLSHVPLKYTAFRRIAVVIGSRTVPSSIRLVISPFVALATNSLMGAADAGIGAAAALKSRFSLSANDAFTSARAYNAFAASTPATWTSMPPTAFRRAASWRLPGVAPASAIFRAVAMDRGLTKTFSRSEDRALRSSSANAGVAPSPSARGGAPPTRSFGEYDGGGSSRRPGRVRYAFWRVSCGRPSRGVGVRKARRQSATTAMAHAPTPSIVFVVGIPHSVCARSFLSASTAQRTQRTRMRPPFALGCLLG